MGSCVHQLVEYQRWNPPLLRRSIIRFYHQLGYRNPHCVDWYHHSYCGGVEQIGITILGVESICEVDIFIANFIFLNVWDSLHVSFVKILQNTKNISLLEKFFLLCFIFVLLGSLYYMDYLLQYVRGLSLMF